MAELPLPTPPLSSDSLTLRGWTDADLGAVVAAFQDPLIDRFVASAPAPCDDAGARSWLASHEPARKDGSRLELAIVRTESDRVLGSIALSSVERLHARAMVSFWVLPEARGRGVASDAVQLLVEWAVGDLGLKRLEMFIEPENVASQRVAERCSFVREGLLRSRWVAKGRRRDSVVYALLSTEQDVVGAAAGAHAAPARRAR
jgi:RimJ/RimL family protein N-acetyltransferase